MESDAHSYTSYPAYQVFTLFQLYTSHPYMGWDSLVMTNVVDLWCLNGRADKHSVISVKITQMKDVKHPLPDNETAYTADLGVAPTTNDSTTMCS